MMPSSHKHSLSLPAIVPVTAPNTPVNSTRTTSNRYVVPVTPQRNSSSLHSKSHSLTQNRVQNQNQNQNRGQTQSAYQPRTNRRAPPQSPSTPLSNSPYTPLSLRSANSSYSYSTPYSYSSSNVTTPGSAHSNMVAKRLVLAGMSPEVRKDDESSLKGQHLADIAENWRSRANENGIRVSAGKVGADVADQGQWHNPEYHTSQFSCPISLSPADERSNQSRGQMPLGRGFRGAYMRVSTLLYSSDVILQ